GQSAAGRYRTEMAWREWADCGQRQAWTRTLRGAHLRAQVRVGEDADLGEKQAAGGKYIGAVGRGVERGRRVVLGNRVGGPGTGRLAGKQVHAVDRDLLYPGRTLVFGDGGGSRRAFAQIHRVCDPAPQCVAGIAVAADARSEE